MLKESKVLVGEVEVRKHILLGGHSSVVTNKRICSNWHDVVAVVNAVSVTDRIVLDISKSGLMKVKAK